MGKTLKWGLAGILILLIAAAITLIMSVNLIVKSGIEEVGSEMTGTAVTVERVSISPFSGSGQISGFRVANPDGFSQPDAMVIDDFSIELDLFSLFSDEIVIHEVLINGPSVYVEQKVPENNINEIMSHMRDVPSGEASDASIVIERFVMTGGSVELYTEIAGEQTARVEINDIELNDLGRGGGSQAAEDVIREIAERVAGESLRGAARSGGEQIRDAIRDIFN
ncbi:AsmA family protein [Rhodohalobacter mucosus]|uniref:AsmA family protein n=1 Tax=Rhodohalobacter mucosus TaxID=2079485 RepID=A0A316TUF1_9BACT|nr:AsmA family protein [Rhodohalobacter mucosus]PWN07301.1 hypothetical protein DDZ15_03265 [Rhodohalobacter mucosus]